jgi:hypothetical protein
MPCIVEPFSSAFLVFNRCPQKVRAIAKRAPPKKTRNGGS